MYISQNKYSCEIHIDMTFFVHVVVSTKINYYRTSNFIFRFNLCKYGKLCRRYFTTSEVKANFMKSNPVEDFFLSNVRMTNVESPDLIRKCLIECHISTYSSNSLPWCFSAMFLKCSHGVVNDKN